MKAESNTADRKVRKRDADATRGHILAAAKTEFAKLGLAGARVDEIAERAGANKRMIYHYFGGKEALFCAVLEEAYLDIRDAERALDLEALPPREAMETLVRFTWEYYLANPEFITLVNSANLHKGRHLENADRLKPRQREFVDMVQRILNRGVDCGVFREGVDPIQLNITIAAIGYYYLTNRHTGNILFQRDFMAPEALKDRLDFNTDTILRLISAES